MVRYISEFEYRNDSMYRPGRKFTFGNSRGGGGGGWGGLLGTGRSILLHKHRVWKALLNDKYYFQMRKKADFRIQLTWLLYVIKI